MHLFTETWFKQFIFIPSEFTVLLTSPEAATRVVLYKKLLLIISQYSQENTCVGVSFIKKRLWRKCFPVNIAKCLRKPILKNLFRYAKTNCVVNSYSGRCSYTTFFTFSNMELNLGLNSISYSWVLLWFEKLNGI